MNKNYFRRTSPFWESLYPSCPWLFAAWSCFFCSRQRGFLHAVSL